MARNDEKAAVAAAAALIAEPVEDVVEATDPEQDAPDDAAPNEPESVEEEVLFPEFEVQLPEDLEQELTEPTLDEVVQEVEDDEQYEDLDEDARRLLARALHAERQAEFYKNQRAANERTKWIEEAKKFMPLSEPFLADISADSRRGFLREAKKYHDAVLPLVKPITDQAKATVEREKEKARAEARAEAEAAWGKVTRDDREPPEATITVEEIHRNRSRGDLSSTIRAMIFSKKED